LLEERRERMKSLSLCGSAGLAVLCFAGLQGSAVAAETGKTGVAAAPMILGSVTDSRALADGIELHSGLAVMRISALDEDVLRVRIGPNGTLPEDASWAVLAQAREHSVAVFPEQSEASVGFHTKALRVQVDRASMQVVVTDLAGNVVEEDVPGRPVEFHGDGFRVYKRMPADEHYFGLGDKAGPLDRRNQAFSMWNTNSYAWQEGTDPVYKAIPFFVTFRDGRAAGVFLDNTFRSSFDFGKENHTEYSFGAEGGPLDYYVMYGPDPKQVLREYAWLTGFTPLPALWTLGYQQSRSSYYPESRVLEIAARLRADHIPADAIYLDIEYQDKYRPFTVDTGRFFEFKQMIADLKKEEFHTVVITDLHIADLPNAKYEPYESGLAGNHFVHNADGSLYIGNVWPGESVFPEFTRAATRAWWGSLYQRFVKDGVAGFWNDMNEPAVFNSLKTMPDDVQHRIDEPGFAARTADHLEIHNVYGMENSRATYEGLRQLRPDERPFVLTRASYAGGQRYATTWTGDTTSTWNHLRLTTPSLLNLGLSGFALSGADVGGFSGTPQPDLLTRWFELAAFQPLDRDHTARKTADKEPWANGPEQEAIRRKYIAERYKLMPYLYTTAEEMARTGLPIMRPLFLEFPNATSDKHPIDLDAGAEFLFGPDLLVAPAPFQEELDAYEVKLPPGGWFDYWTGAVVRSAEGSAEKPVTIHPQLAVLPVYVRGGTVLPMQAVTSSTMETPAGPLTLRVYPGKDCKGTLYLDDGHSFGYDRGESTRVAYTCEQTGRGIVLQIAAREGAYPVWWKQVRVEFYGVAAMPRAVRVNGESRPFTKDDFDAAQHRAGVVVNDSGQAQEIEIETGHPAAELRR
jgi:alpha-glucosidase